LIVFVVGLKLKYFFIQLCLIFELFVYLQLEELASVVVRINEELL